jgi:hypothetical protein
MELLDWMLVLFGVAVAFCGGRLQLHPERLFPRGAESGEPDRRALAQLRLLGGCFLFMGSFFTLQMTADLCRLPWWSGALAGLTVAVAAVNLVGRRRRSSVPSLAARPQAIGVHAGQ